MNNKLNDQFLSRKKNQYFLKHITTIFVRLELNFNDNIKNSAKFSLSTDCLKNSSKLLLFKIVVNTLEYKILNLLEVEKVGSVSSEYTFIILEETISASIEKFLKIYLNEIHLSFAQSGFGMDFSLCDLVIWNHILNYFNTGDFLVFQQQKSLTLSQKLLEEHILALLDHFVIKLSNIVIDSILNFNNNSLFSDCLDCICKTNYLDQRNLINFKNNLLLSKGWDFYIYNPKLIYENKYSLFTIESSMICRKNIYSNRQNELRILSRTQLIILLILEIQDLLLPKLKNIVYLFGKSLLYIFLYILRTFMSIVGSRVS
nr:Ycf55 [Sahlingia subintegra]